MAQQQPRQNEFENDQRDYDVRHRDPDVIKNFDDESDRWRDKFGSRTGTDPVANYAYGNVGSGGYGAPPTGGPYGGLNYGASGFEYSTAYGTTGAAPTEGYGTVGADQWGREGNADRGGDGGRNRKMDMDMNRNRNMDMNMGRDQKK